MVTMRFGAVFGLMIAGLFWASACHQTAASSEREPAALDTPASVVHVASTHGAGDPNGHHRDTRGGDASAVANPPRCLPVVAAECGCVYACGSGESTDNKESYRVTHSHWEGTTLRAHIRPWCVEGKCTDAFHADIVCDGICEPRPADPSCAFRDGVCRGETSPVE